MNEPRSLFYAYRYMITPKNQLNLFSELASSNKTKEQLMNDIFEDIYNSDKTPFKFAKKRYIFFPITRYRKKLFLFNFAKEDKGKKYIEGETSVKVVEDNRLKPVLVYIHSECQIILIERKTTAFQTIKNTANVIEWYFRDRVKHFDYTIKLYPLSNPEKFWETIEEAEAIYEVSLTLNAPNMFGGNADLRQMIEEIKNETNNDETTVDIRSRDGNLHVEKSFWQNPIEYIARIGGKYSIIFKKDGVRQRKTNLDNIEKTHIERHKDDQYTDEELANVEQKMRVIDGRSTDKSSNEE